MLRKHANSLEITLSYESNWTIVAQHRFAAVYAVAAVAVAVAAHNILVIIVAVVVVVFIAAVVDQCFSDRIQFSCM